MSQSMAEEGRMLSTEQIIIRKAEYGSDSVKADVTNIVAIALATAGGRRLRMVVGNEAMGGDPHFGMVKTLAVQWSLSSDMDKAFVTEAAEGTPLILEPQAR